MQILILVSIIAFLLGFFFSQFIKSVVDKWKEIQKKKAIESYFEEIKSQISSGNSEFITRVNNIVILGMKMRDFGDVIVSYTIEPKEISILKDNKEILSSKDLSLKNKIILTQNIEEKHKQKIQDVIEVFGQLFNREEFEHSMKETISNVKKMLGEDLTPDKKVEFTIDDILDKINKVGIDNLTEEEKEFLRKFNK